MTRPLEWLASTAVRTWTRVYTCGMPALSRDVRRDEIESDLWEWQHDPDRGTGPGAAANMFLRLVLGMPDDLFWRETHAPHGKSAALRTVATVLLVLMAWAYVQFQRPEPLPQPPSRPMQFVSDRPGIPPPPPPPPPRPPNLQ
jgi:hypothetical protein